MKKVVIFITLCFLSITAWAYLPVSNDIAINTAVGASFYDDGGSVSSEDFFKALLALYLGLLITLIVCMVVNSFLVENSKRSVISKLIYSRDYDDTDLSLAAFLFVILNAFAAVLWLVYFIYTLL